MRSLLTTGLLIVGTLVAGCGSRPLPLAASQPLAASRVSSLNTTGLTITDAKEVVVVPAPVPGHNYPVQTRITVNGTDGGKRFSLVIETLNPNGNFFVPFLKSVTLNNVMVTDAAVKLQWSQRLREVMDQAPTNARFALSQATNMLRRQAPPSK